MTVSARHRAPYAFLAPAVAVLLAAVAVPIAIAFGLSFMRYRWNAPALGADFVGFDNYVSLARNPEVLASAGWTLAFTVSSVAAELVLGLAIALFLNRRVAGRLFAVLRGVFLVPLMLSGVIAGFLWRLLFDAEYGPVNHVLGLVGLERVGFFSEPTATRVMVVLAEVWLTTPFVMLILLAGLQSIPPEYDEAAQVDGAGPVQRFLAVTLPLLRNSIMIVLIIRTMDALRAFDLIYILTRGGPGTSTSTLMTYDYKYAFTYYQMGPASALAFAFLLLIAGITWIFLRLLRREEVVT